MELFLQFLHYKWYTFSLGIIYIILLGILTKNTKLYIPTLFYGIVTQVAFMIYFIRTGITLMQPDKSRTFNSFNSFLNVIEVFWVIFFIPFIVIIFFKLLNSSNFKSSSLGTRLILLFSVVVGMVLAFIIGGEIYTLLYYGFAP